MGAGVGQRSNRSKVNTAFCHPNSQGPAMHWACPRDPGRLALHSSLLRKVVFGGHSLRVRDPGCVSAEAALEGTQLPDTDLRGAEPDPGGQRSGRGKARPRLPGKSLPPDRREATGARVPTACLGTQETP